MNTGYCLSPKHYEKIPRELFVDLEFTGSTKSFHIEDTRTFDDPSAEPEICFGPFASCPPPEMTEEQWEIILNSEEIKNE